eukprot:COSAG06_NODE_7278_length_2562_cov_56.757613_1_plen_122_part_00
MNSGAMETALDCSSEPMLLRRLLLLRLPSDPVLVKVFLERRVSALCRLQSIRSDPIDSAMFRLLVSSLACLGKHLSLSSRQGDGGPVLGRIPIGAHVEVSCGAEPQRRAAAPTGFYQGTRI